MTRGREHSLLIIQLLFYQFDFFLFSYTHDDATFFLLILTLFTDKMHSWRASFRLFKAQNTHGCYLIFFFYLFVTAKVGNYDILTMAVSLPLSSNHDYFTGNYLQIYLNF